MRITIDTQHDSKEDIRKVIRMLSTVISEQELGPQSSRNIFDNSNPSPIGNLFDNNQTQQQSSQPASNDVFGSLFDAPVQTQKKDEDEGLNNSPPITEYF